MGIGIHIAVIAYYIAFCNGVAYKFNDGLFFRRKCFSIFVDKESSDLRKGYLCLGVNPQRMFAFGKIGNLIGTSKGNQSWRTAVKLNIGVA